MPKKSKETKDEILTDKVVAKKAKNVKKEKNTKNSRTKAKSITEKLKSLNKKDTKKEVKLKQEDKSEKTLSTEKNLLSNSDSQKNKKNYIVEYYDLPYKYNKTIVKVLAQTPNTLFVYWEISDTDRQSYIKKYGENFFETTRPVLIVHNKDYDYSYEVPINDFANSWYLQINDAKSKYEIELGRRPIYSHVHNIPINSDYVHVASSNIMEAPNDHILFDRIGKSVFFRNVKTNSTTSKDVSTLSFMTRVEKIHNVKDLYNEIYNNETSLTFDKMDLTNPSSNNPTSSFK